MDRALYTSMTGAKQNTLAQAVHANNLANVSTDGFRRDFVAARSMGIYYGDGFPTRAHALRSSSTNDARLRRSGNTSHTSYRLGTRNNTERLRIGS